MKWNNIFIIDAAIPIPMIMIHIVEMMLLPCRVVNVNKLRVKILLLLLNSLQP